MQLIQFLAAWLFPGPQCFSVDMATDDASEIDRASSSSSPSSSANVAGAGSGSSVSSPSSSTSSSDGRHSGFFIKYRSRLESPSTTPLCFGAGGAGAAGRTLPLGRSRAQAPAKQPAAATMAPKVKGDVVGRYLRKISRRMRKARSDGKGSPSPIMAAAAVDDTARERAEAVARAISYCKDTLRRGTSRSRSRSPSPPPPPPSPSLDDWLHDRQDEIVAAAAEQHCDEECSSDPRPSPTRPRRAAGGWPLGIQTTAKRLEESPCPCTASPCRDSSLVACDVAHGAESPRPRHGHGRRGESSMSSLDEMEFLKTFDGDEEMISHHFITVEI